MHITKNGKWFSTNHDASLGHLIESLDNAQIDKAVVLPIAPYISNEFVAKACSEYSDKLIGFASVNPCHSESVKILEDDINKYNLKGLKIHPKIQGFQLSEYSVNIVIEKAAELNIPILIDAFIKPKDTNFQNLVMDIGKIAQKYPSAKIILPHLGGFNHNEILQVMNENNNIYFDLSFVLRYFKFNQEILFESILPTIKKIGANRLIYGSDSPEREIKNYFNFTNKLLDNIGFTPTEKEKVFSKNILKLIG